LKGKSLFQQLLDWYIDEIARKTGMHRSTALTWIPWISWIVFNYKWSIGGMFSDSGVRSLELLLSSLTPLHI
jgi:hypothetical protein